VQAPCTDDLLTHYGQLGFRHTKETENYTQLLTTSDRFSIYSDKRHRDRHSSLVVCDVDDVFWTTACYTANEINMQEFNTTNHLDFGALTHKIVGYNCVAEGSKTSYCISRMIPQALPGMDLVFRMRKQFLGIPEQILELASA
jgi:hypothetical protein